ncbi:MAG: AmmeMemoRadiSam system protein A [Deltaproteobacteria bacterium]|nr:AmmeMemoRadiSam system protein A [Deltaproteobacteria bacterium]
MPLTKTEKETLLRVARAAVETIVKRVDPPLIEAQGASMQERRGAFVSLHKGGRLRGCIGMFASDTPLCKTIAGMAKAAATQDTRFAPVLPDELQDIEIEISALSPLKKIKDVSEIEVGRHGIYIIKGMNRGVLLPQVATELGLGREEFLDQTCLKAGLPAGSWRKGAEILVFEAEIFREGSG